MNLLIKRTKTIGPLIITFILLLLVTTPATSLQNTSLNIQGWSTGVSYQSVIPIKKTTFVKYDDKNYLDDYAYLACIPTSVFSYNNQLISSPLMFYQEDLDYEDEKEKTLNAHTGIKYFMEDWMSFCGGNLDQLIGINIEEKDVKDWNANQYIFINEDNPYDLASQIAQNDWSYSKKAIVAVIEENFENPDMSLSNSIQGTFPAENIQSTELFQLKQTNSLNPIYQEFNVGSKYKYLKAEAWWDGILLAGITMIPTGDPDLQLYCKEDGMWMQTAAISNWNIYAPAGHEYAYTHVYNPGTWRLSITDFPTETEAPRRNVLGGLIVLQGSLLKAISPKVTYHVDVEMYPGIELDIPDTPSFGCRDAIFKLTWDNPNIQLGFSLIGPNNEVIFSAINESRDKSQEMHIYQLGECLPGQNYSISVFSLDDVNSPVSFNIDYEWHQNFSKKEGNALASATEASVLASIHNSPLLYTNNKEVPKPTIETLQKLGVEEIHLIDIGDSLKDQLVSEIKNLCKKLHHYTKLKQIYSEITDKTKNRDVIFSTIDPWTYWYLNELKPGGETEAALFLGPAAYLAAHHGSPVFIVDMHPELSNAVVWHNQFWRSYVAERYEHIPSVADMVLTGRQVYEFLDELGFDTAERETIITVAGQYDIGIPWDRVFVGKAKTGRIWGTPIDTSYWISRCVFYPGLIFENPGVGSITPISLINGSISTRQGARGLLKYPRLNTLVIKRETEEEDFKYPVLCSFVTHKYRFNERASKYYKTTYQCADGLIPGVTNTLEEIDQGVNEKYYNQEGSFFPDMTESEVIPFYLQKGGFDTVFSTKLEAVADNLNTGVILWIHASHGVQQNCGMTLFWDPEEGYKGHPFSAAVAGALKEDNPWRGYDWLLGSTEEPDTMSMDFKGIIPFTNINSLFLPATGMDWVLARKPIRERINNLLDLIRIIPFRLKDENLYDGLTGTLSFSKYPLSNKNSLEMEELIDNLHSMGFITSICQTSNTYLQLMMIRHGSVFQIQDPWPTSWYGAIWRQSIPRDIILGDTVGEAYVKGMSHVGILYLGDNDGTSQWWWDSAENVVYFGDPDLRMYVPSTKYSDANHWVYPEIMPHQADMLLDGHAPFGSTSYPKSSLNNIMWDLISILLFAIAIVILLIVFLFTKWKKASSLKRK